ncbi:MAG TPA: FtsH protease activity modulator HflK [Betaproteobacteria bacterium]|nr:FtsH protease activity modulator HflK [Betaproteobacteria bacterium]
MAWNDPQWGGRRNNDGPPDLDELWRKFNQRLSGLFGGKGGGGGGSPARRLGGIGLLAGVIVAVWLASGFYIVSPASRGVVQRFGKYIETTREGPHWHLPYPIETVTVINIDQIRTVPIGYRDNVKNAVPSESLMLTDDENIIDIQFAVQYNLKSAKNYLFANRNPDAAVKQAAESAIREVVGRNKMDFVLYEGREEVAARAAKLMQKILDYYRTGINIVKVTMQNAQPPEQVQAAFDDAVKAGQDKARLKNEGQAYANGVIPKARGTAARLLAEAQGYEQRVVDTAQGNASRFQQVMVEYDKAPKVTRERLYLDAMQHVLSNTSKVLVDQKGGHNLLYLPLDKLMHPAAQPPSPATSPAATSTAPRATKPTDNYRSRSAFRSREREERP